AKINGIVFYNQNGFHGRCIKKVVFSTKVRFDHQSDRDWAMLPQKKSNLHQVSEPDAYITANLVVDEVQPTPAISPTS
ncbi:MAG: hypothetical protein RIG63_05045, partial [Coleofasciculus chthonoplastes F3-SA18-01]|uniref:hypothetical protein n=1 Tax=Coleofasciculus chthonoplastes TaxID=64178 RepID=UPI0032F4BAC8